MLVATLTDFAFCETSKQSNKQKCIFHYKPKPGWYIMIQQTFFKAQRWNSPLFEAETTRIAPGRLARPRRLFGAAAARGALVCFHIWNVWSTGRLLIANYWICLKTKKKCVCWMYNHSISRMSICHCSTCNMVAPRRHGPPQCQILQPGLLH